MNPIWREAANSLPEMSGHFMGATSLFMMLLFLAWSFWAYAPSRKREMQEIAKYPFMDGE